MREWMKEKTYPLILTGFSECLKGVFKDGQPPLTQDDVLMEIQAIMCYEHKGKIHGKMLIIIAREDFGSEPFNIQFLSERRDPPYRTIGYDAVRTLKNVRLKTNVSKDNTDYHEQFIEFIADEDVNWQEIDFLYKEYQNE